MDITLWISMYFSHLLSTLELHECVASVGETIWDPGWFWDGVILDVVEYRPIGSESEVAQWCPTLCVPRDCSLPSSSIHRIFQARILEWVVISFSRRPSRPRDWTQVLPHYRQTLYPLSHQGSPNIEKSSHINSLEFYFWGWL